MIYGREEQTSRLEEMKDQTGVQQETADQISVMFSLTAFMPQPCDLCWGNSIASWVVLMEKYVINIKHLVGQKPRCENNG